MNRVWLVFICVLLAICTLGSSALAQICSDRAGSIQTNGGTLLMCPGGDGQSLSDINATLSVHVIDRRDRTPIPGIPASEFWLEGAVGNFAPCGDRVSASAADAPTDSNGDTTMSGTVVAGGHAEFLVAGTNIEYLMDETELPACRALYEWYLALRSPDLNGDLVVDAIDFSMFGEAFLSMEGDPNYSSAADLDNDGDVDLIDFSLFGDHWQHSCGM